MNKTEVCDRSLLAEDRLLDDDSKLDQTYEREQALILQTAAVPCKEVGCFIYPAYPSVVSLYKYYS